MAGIRQRRQRNLMKQPVFAIGDLVRLTDATREIAAHNAADPAWTQGRTAAQRAGVLAIAFEYAVITGRRGDEYEVLFRPSNMQVPINAMKLQLA